MFLQLHRYADKEIVFINVNSISVIEVSPEDYAYGAYIKIGEYDDLFVCESIDEIADMIEFKFVREWQFAR